jgi:hypothetical protein
LSHAALVNDGLFFLFIAVFLTVLLVMFVYALIQLARESAGSAEPPARKKSGPARPRLPRLTLSPGTAGQSGDSGDPASELDAAPPGQDVVHAPKVAGVPPWEPAPKPPGLAG